MCDPPEKSVELTYRCREGRGRDVTDRHSDGTGNCGLAEARKGRAMSDKAGDRVELNVQGLK